MGDIGTAGGGDVNVGGRSFVELREAPGARQGLNGGAGATFNQGMEEENSERRRDVRAHASPPAQILRLGSAERVEVLNASYRGLFLRLNGGAPPLNQLLKLRIQLPTRAVIVHCVPVRVVPDGNGRAGIGVRFFALNGQDKQIWESYISSLLAPRTAAA